MRPYQIPHTMRLAGLLAWMRQAQAEGTLQVNGATWFARHRHDRERAPVGCMLGHFVAATRPGPISLVPITWLSQLKVPMLQTELLADLPLKDWQHFTLHYQSNHLEGFGLVAATVFLRMKPQLVQRLFLPQGYERLMPVESLVLTLARIAGEDPCTQSQLPYSDPC